MNVQPNLPSLTHSPQIIPFYDTSFFKYKNYFQGFFLPDDYSLVITTLQQQQSQDPVRRSVYSWIIKNEKPETLTPLITGTLFLHAYYKRFTQLFIDDSTNLISLYTKHPTTINQSSTPDFVRATIRICLTFRLFKTVFNKLHEHSHTGIKITYNTFTQYYSFHLLKNGFPYLYMTVLNVNAINTSTKKFKLLLHNPFQNMLHPSITVFQWTLKDLLILRLTTNHIYM